MTIEEFAHELIHIIQKKFPDLSHDAEFTVQQVPKPGNLILTGITIRLHGAVTAPCFYINDQYTKLLEGMPIQAIASDLADTIRYQSNLPDDIDLELLTNFDAAKNYIVPKLIDMRPGRNDGYLADRPAQRLPGIGIGIIYDIELPRAKDDPTMTVPITNHMLACWDRCLKDIHTAAIANGPRLRPAKLSSLSSIIEDMCPGAASGTPDDPMMMVLTNEDACHGAAVILYPAVPDMIQHHYPNGCYLLPSSVHEWIIVPKISAKDPDELRYMVMSINQSQVAPAEVLSDGVFELDEKGRLVSASSDDVPFD